MEVGGRPNVVWLNPETSIRAMGASESAPHHAGEVDPMPALMPHNS
jgi:hypothetical protein